MRVAPSPSWLDPDELAACVGCGLCLPHCPTWRATGDEARSPRGRIDAMRLVEQGELELSEPSVLDAMQTCVQCRGCEPACPSGVRFGHLMEGTRAAMVTGGDRPPALLRVGLRLLGRHRLLLAGSSLLGLAQRTGLVPGRLSRRLGLPRRIPVRRGRLVATGDDVVLFTGCVMDAWQRHVHVAAIEVLTAMGLGVALPGPGAACCGALELHAGLRRQATRRAASTVRALPGDRPVLVDSAGCGAHLVEVGELLGSEDARAVAAQAQDIAAFVAEHLDRLPTRRHLGRRAAVADPCHLRHVQGRHMAVRQVLAGVVDVVELDDDGLCCGAGGTFALTQPELAAEIRERKLAAIERSGAPLVVSSNPGCSLHLAAAGLSVVHPMELLAEALRQAR